MALVVLSEAVFQLLCLRVSLLTSAVESRDETCVAAGVGFLLGANFVGLVSVYSV